MARNRRLTSFFILAFILLLTRTVGIALTGEVASQDMSYWKIVTAVLARGGNPYIETPYLNWPPFWMICLWGFDQLATTSNIPLNVCIKIGLMAADLAVLWVIYLLLNQVRPNENHEKLILFGFVLNPLAIILTCVHGNFDVFVALWCGLTVLFTLRFAMSESPIDRLASAAFLGLGILTKTVPFLLFPLLFLRARRRPLQESILAAFLAIFPAVLGLGILYVLGSAAVDEKVIGYRGNPGWFGVSGMLDAVGYPFIARKVYPSIFFISILGGLTFLVKQFQESSLIAGRQILACSIFMLLMVPMVGPGFGLQYAYWSLPLLVVGIVFLGPRFAQASRYYLLTCAVVYPFLYAFAPDLGAFLPHIAGKLGYAIEPLTLSKLQSTIVTLPIFASGVWVLIECARVALEGLTIKNRISA